jgi:two-component system, cell cycle sensor histidine kinase and response regulator CckA
LRTSTRLPQTVSPELNSPQNEERSGDLSPHREATTILFADDDVIMRKIAVCTLTRAGYSVLAAADGEEAVRLFLEHRPKIALVILDAAMPRRTGEEVFCYLRSLGSKVKVVFYTGYERNSLRLECLKSENIPVIQKPCLPPKFLELVQQVLDAPAPEPGNP